MQGTEQTDAESGSKTAWDARVDSSRTHDADNHTVMRMEGDLQRSFRKFRGKLRANHFMAWRTRTDGVAEYVDQQWLD